MEDWINFPQPTRAVLARPTMSNALDVRAWLMAIAALVFVMVLVGGATRLTELAILHHGVEASYGNHSAIVGRRMDQGL